MENGYKNTLLRDKVSIFLKIPHFLELFFMIKITFNEN